MPGATFLQLLLPLVLGAVLGICYSKGEFLFFSSCPLLYYSLRVGKLLFSSLLGLPSWLAQEEDSGAFIPWLPNSRTSEPSDEGASLHAAAANTHFLSLFLGSSFENSWLPSFRLILPRQYFKNIISFPSLFCPT